MTRFLVVLIAALAIVAPAFAAEPVQVTIHDGRVSIDAHDATVPQILAEWARVGRTRIVNGDRVPGGRLTLQLTNVTEQEALDLLLRTAGGYIAAPRAVTTVDASRFDRILILPTSSAPPPAVRPGGAAPPAVRPAAAAPAPPVFPQPQVFPQPPAPVTLPGGVQRVTGPDGQPLPDDQQGVQPPQRFVPLPPGFDGVQGTQQAPPPTTPYIPPPAPGTTPTAPAGSTVPGMPVPPPQQPQPIQVPPIQR
jgi:hypothetical protein